MVETSVLVEESDEVVVVTSVVVEVEESVVVETSVLVEESEDAVVEVDDTEVDVEAPNGQEFACAATSLLFKTTDEPRAYTLP